MKRIFIVLLCFYITNTVAAVFTPKDVAIMKKHFLANITDSGAVIASPSKEHPNYFFHWVRDAAITMGLVESWYEQFHHKEDKTRLFNYVHWVENVQHQTDTLPGQDILGEPKFYLDGKAFDDAWGRPQNDGPALRALTLTRFAKDLLKNNEKAYVQTHLYGSGLDPMTMGAIKMDLEYTAHHWQDQNYDLWEEVYGHHFFTAMVQRKALLEGAVLARQLNDTEAANYYTLQANLIETGLYQYIDTDNLIIQATLAPHAGPQKTLELDSAVILAVLLGNTHDNVFAVDNVLVKNTADALKQQFKSLYPINDQHDQAILFGRYPGDTYDGYRNDGLGNPWFILTATMAEYYYTQAFVLPATKANQPRILRFIEQGDDYLMLVKQYGGNLNLSEQINLNTGEQQGAFSLTWSYVAILRAINLREKLMS